jgi:hypothetical protein
MDDDPPGYRDAPNAVGERWYSPWGVTLERETLVVGGAPVTRIPPDAPGARRPRAVYVLPDRPALCVSSWPTKDRPKATGVTFVDCTGRPVAQITLAGGAEIEPELTGLTAVGRGRLVGRDKLQLFVISVPEEVAECAAPLRLAPDYPVQLATAVGETRLVVPKVEGAAPGAVEIALTREPGGMRFDAKNGRFVLAPDALVEKLTHEIGSRVGRSAGYRRGVGSAFLDEYRKRTAEPFERLTGRKPTGVPVWVPFEVKVTNAGRQAVGKFGFFVDLPLAGVLARADKVTAGVPAVPAGPVADLLREHDRLNRRIDELEKKADDLNRKLDALLKAVEAAPKK